TPTEGRERGGKCREWVTWLLLLLHRGLFTVVTLIFSATVLAALKMLRCETVSVADGMDAQGDAIIREATVLASNPAVECYSSDHLPAAALAIAVIVVVVLLFPLLTGLFVKRSLTGSGLLHSCSAVCLRRRLTRSTKANKEQKSTAAAAASRPAEALWLAFAKQEEAHPLLFQQDLIPWIGSEYRPSLFWIKQCDLLLLFGIAMLHGFSVDSSVFYAIQLVVTCLAAAALTALLLVSRPFFLDQRWKLPVRIASLWLAALASLAALLIYESTRRPSDAALQGAMEAVTYAVVAGSVALLLVLIIAFFVELLRGAAAEANKNNAVTAATASTRKALPRSRAADPWDGTSGKVFLFALPESPAAVVAQCLLRLAADDARLMLAQQGEGSTDMWWPQHQEEQQLHGAAGGDASGYYSESPGWTDGMAGDTSGGQYDGGRGGAGGGSGTSENNGAEWVEAPEDDDNYDEDNDQQNRDDSGNVIEDFDPSTVTRVELPPAPIPTASTATASEELHGWARHYDQGVDRHFYHNTE
ncbi:unnamed protein product, partial [Symbiodinium sp. KB8]